MSYSNPTIPSPPGTVFIDSAIEDLKAKLQTIDWHSHSFGRAYIRKTQRDKIDFKEPMVYGEDGEYVPVQYNDNLQSMSFFLVGEKTPYGEWEKNSQNYWEVETSLIFWANINKIDAARAEDYYFSESLQEDVRALITDLVGIPYRVSIDSMTDEPDEVYKEFSFKEEEKQFLTWPYTGFRFELTMIVQDKCNN